MISQPDRPADPRAMPGDLRASEVRYRRLFEAAQDGILILDADTGRIVDVNPFLLKILGHPYAYFIGKELWEIGFFEDAAASKEAFLELQASSYIRYEDLPLRTRDGRHIDVEFVSNLYLVDGQRIIQCNIREITERKQAEAALRASESLLRNLIEQLPQGIRVTDREAVVLYCNAHYAADLGRRPEEVIGRGAAEFLPPEVAAEHDADDQQVLRSGVLRDTESLLAGAAPERWVHTIKVPYRDEQGRTIGVLALVEDITARKRLEAQFLQSQKLEGLGLLAGGVAHDFNNLLTGILGYCDLFSSRLRADDPLAHDIEQIRKCGERATSLTRQLLAFSRKQVMEVRVFDLNALVGELQRLLERLIGEDIDLKSVLAPDLGAVRADPGQIEQVVVNLVVNARDAMPTGGILTLTTANVELDAEYAGAHHAVQPGHYVMLAVADNGAGMDEAALARIFEPFFTTKEQGKGTGLGLSTVHGIVKQSGGDIWCYSEPAQGTTFKIYLPRVEAPAAGSALPRATTAPRGSETLLVAEDDDMVRAITVEMLTLAGYRVIPTKSGEEALRAHQDAAGAIDLLITDMVMPGMSGTQLMRRLSTLAPKLRTLFISGYTGDAALRHGMIAEGTAFLQKPFTMVSLNRKVREMLDR